MEEFNPVAVFPDLHARVGHIRETFRQCREFVIVRREKNLRRTGGDVVNIFENGPGDAHAVVGRRSAAYFVEDDEAAIRERIQDSRGFHHFNHKGAVASRQFIPRPDTGEDSIENADLGGRRGNERADLREKAQERGHTKIGRLSRHIGPRQNDDPLPVRFKDDVIRDEDAVRKRGFHDGVTSPEDPDVSSLVQYRRDISSFTGDLREGTQDVDRGEKTSERLNCGYSLKDVANESLREGFLEFENFLFSEKAFFFKLLQLGGDVSLRVDESLPAFVVIRERCRLRFPEFEIISVDAVVSGLELRLT